MALNCSKVLGVAAVLGTLGLAEARAQGVSPGDGSLSKQQQFSSFLLGQRLISAQQRDINAEQQVIRRQDNLVARRNVLQTQGPLRPLIQRLQAQIARLQGRFDQILIRLCNRLAQVDQALARLQPLGPGSARLNRLETRATLQRALIAAFHRRPCETPPATPVACLILDEDHIDSLTASEGP